MSTITNITQSDHGKSQIKITGDILVNFSVVKEKTGFGRSFLYREIAEGRFPRPAKIGAKASRWALSEVQSWIDARIADREEVKK